MHSGWRAHNQPDRQAALRPALEHVLLGVVPLVFTVWLVVAAVSFHWVAQDFSLSYYPAAHRLLQGGSPYAATHAQIVSGAAFVYPALSAIVLAPLALISAGFADHLYTLMCLAMVPGTLWVVGVRDWRVYGVSLLWFPIVIGWQGENISVPMMFLAALAWRYRDRPVIAALIVAIAISMKPFVWPLWLWLIATRRFRASVWTLAWGLLVNLLAWGIVGFSEISTYLHRSSEDTHALLRGGYSILAVAHHTGLGNGVGAVLLIAASAVIALSVLYLGLVRKAQRQAFVLAIALMLIASPLVWIHYFVLLLLPLAVSRPRFDVAWALPIAMWLLPPATSISGWQLALAWVLVAACFSAAFHGRPLPGNSPNHRPGTPLATVAAAG